MSTDDPWVPLCEGSIYELPIASPPTVRALYTRAVKGLWPALLVYIVTWSGCRSNGAIGAPCSADKDCSAGLSCVGDLPGGYCTRDCSQSDCGEGATCAAISGA